MQCTNTIRESPQKKIGWQKYQSQGGQIPKIPKPNKKCFLKSIENGAHVRKILGPIMLSIQHISDGHVDSYLSR